MRFILDEHNVPIAEPSLHKWSAWHSTHEDRVCIGHEKVGKKTVSTRFFGTDTAGLRCMFETMVFADHLPIHAMTRRYETYDEAVAGHRETIERIKKGEYS